MRDAASTSPGSTPRTSCTPTSTKTKTNSHSATTAMAPCVSAAAPATTAVAGPIGFVGLIVPHACRFAFGPDHRVLIPAVVLAGGAFLVLCDTLARTIIAPQQLPVGAITAMIGAPVFLYQLHRLRK